jgi:hypothetical protein
MGMAKLNVWISGMDDPCAVSNRSWYVTIYDCDGKVLSWCRKRYLVLHAPCGHLEVELPPGCYRLNAVWGYYQQGETYWGNHFTDSVIVQAGCDEHVCVKLFNPSIHRCGQIFKRAVMDMIKQKTPGLELANTHIQSLNELLKILPPPVKKFELAYLDEIDELVQSTQPQKDQLEEPKTEPPVMS